MVADTKPAKFQPYKFAYCFGRGADGVKNDAFVVFLITYYHVVLGLNATILGIVLACALIIDAFSDPLTAWFSDRHQSKWGLGRRHLFLYIAPIPLGIFYLALWMPPDALLVDVENSPLGLALWLGVCAVGVRVSLTLFHVPHLAMIPELTLDYAGRTRLSGGAQVMSWLAAVMSSLLAYYVFLADSDTYENGAFDPANYPAFGIYGAIMMAIFIWTSALGTHAQIPNMREPTDRRIESPFAIFKHLLEAVRYSRSFFALIFVSTFSVAAFRLGQALQIQINTLFWELAPQQIGLLVLAVAAGVFLAYVLADFLTRRFDKRTSLITLGLGYSFIAPLSVVLRLLDLMPENGDPKLLPILATLAFLAAGCGIGGTIVAQSMMADVTDEYAHKYGQRREAMFFSATSFIAKFAAALGVIGAGQVLAFVNIPKGIKSASELAPESLFWLGVLEGPLSAVIGAIGLIGLISYSISRKRYAKIQADLKKRGLLAHREEYAIDL